MTDEELLKITGSIEEKLGDNSAVIADDLGLLITGNTNSQKALQEKDDQIAELKAMNEKLVLANGNLLKQVPIEGSVDHSQGGNTHSQGGNNSEVKGESEYPLSSIFDKSGRFAR